MRELFLKQLHLCRLICEEETKRSTDQQIKLLEALQQYFGKKGELEHCSFEQLVTFAERVYDRYLCLAAYDDTCGNYARDPKIYGEFVDIPPNTDSGR